MLANASNRNLIHWVASLVMLHMGGYHILLLMRQPAMPLWGEKGDSLQQKLVDDQFEHCSNQAHELIFEASMSVYSE